MALRDGFGLGGGFGMALHGGFGFGGCVGMAFHRSFGFGDRLGVALRGGVRVGDGLVATRCAGFGHACGFFGGMRRLLGGAGGVDELIDAGIERIDLIVQVHA